MTILATPVDLRTVANGGVMTYVDGGAGSLDESRARLFFNAVDSRKVHTYGYATCATLKAANYISTDNFDSAFTHYFMCQAESITNSGREFMWGVAYLAGSVSDLGQVDADGGSYLAIVNMPNGTNSRLYCDICRLGTRAYTLVYTVPARMRFRPIYCKVEWAPDTAGGTLTLTCYEDPALTIQLATGSHHWNSATQTITGLTYFYPASSLYDNNTPYSMTGWSGDFYLETTPPANMFKTYMTSLPYAWDQTEDLSVETGWAMTTPAGGCAFTDDDHFPGTTTHCFHFTGDTTDTDNFAYGTKATSVNVWEAHIVKATVHIESVVASCRLPLFGVSNSTTEEADHGYFCFVYNNAGSYLLRLAYYKGPVLAVPAAWTYSASNSTTVDSYRNDIDIADHDFEIMIASMNNYSNQTWLHLYVRNLTHSGTGTYDEYWRCVDSIQYNFGDNGHPTYNPISYRNVDYTMNQLVVGNQSHLAASVCGEFYIKDLMFHDGGAYFPTLARGNTGDNTIILNYGRQDNHSTPHNAAIVFVKSTDGGVTWTLQATVQDADLAYYGQGCIVWDGSQWIVPIWHVDPDTPAETYGGIYTSSATENCADIDTKVATHTALIADTIYTRHYLSRIVENGNLLMGVFHWQDERYNPAERYIEFGRLDISEATLSTCIVARTNEVANYYLSEPFVWRSASGTPTNGLRMGIRWDDDDGTPRMKYTYYICKHDPATVTTNEGLDYQTGTADADVLNTLDDTGEDFTASNGSTRLNAVGVGWSVRNTTSREVASVTAVAPEGDVSRLTLSADIFPNGNEPYEISCWGVAQNPSPTEQYVNQAGLLRAFAFQGYLYMQGYDQDAYRASAGPTTTFISKASDSDLSVFSERVFGMAGARTPGADLLEPGNGVPDAANQSGNHYLDWCCDFGPALFMRLDAVDQLAPTILGSWHRKSTSALKYHGVTKAISWHGANWG